MKNNEMPYMKYIIDGIPPEIKKKAEDELGETEEVKAECLKDLRNLIKSEPDLHSCMEDVFLLRFLRAKKFRVDKAFKTLKNFYMYKATYSGILTDLRPSDIVPFLETKQATALEYRDSNYAGVGVMRVGHIDFHKMTPDELLGSILVLAEYGVSMESVVIAGYVLIIDFEGLSLHTLKKFASPTWIYRIITVIQDCIPCRIKGFHILNQPYLFHILLSIAKTLMTEKLSKRLHLHGSNLKSLYNHVPQEILPEELGGKQGPISQYLKEYSKKIFAAEDYYIKMNKFGYQGKTLEQLQKDNHHAIVT